MSIRIVWAVWYDCWVGAYWDRKARRLYVLPMPWFGVCLDFGPKILPEAKETQP